MELDSFRAFALLGFLVSVYLSCNFMICTFFSFEVRNAFIIYWAIGLRRACEKSVNAKPGKSSRQHLLGSNPELDKLRVRAIHIVVHRFRSSVLYNLHRSTGLPV